MSGERSTALGALFLGALLIDLVILAALSRVAVLIGAPSALGMGAGAAFFLIFGALVVVHAAASEVFAAGWTIGKAVLGLRARSADGAPTLPQRLERLGRRLIGEGFWRAPVNGVPAPDHSIGVRYATSLLPEISGPPRDRDWSIRILNGRFKNQVARTRAFRRFRHNGVIRIGRDRRWADLWLPDRSVSRRHAILICEDGELFACDQGSRHGTRVDGRPLSGERQVEIGQEAQLQFGGAMIVLQRISLR